MKEEDVDAVIERLLLTCPCAACERLRAFRLRRIAYYAARIEEGMRR